MMLVRPATDADEQGWTDFLARTAAGDFLHDWAWAEVAAFDGQPQRRYLLEEDGTVTALAAAQVRPILRGRTFWYVPHGPVLDYGDVQAAERLRALLIGLREAGRQDRALAVKLEPRLVAGDAGARLLAGRGLRQRHDMLQVGQTRLVELRDDDGMLASLDKDTRYAVRRAQREGVGVVVKEDADNEAAIDALHAMVVETQRRAGFPLPPLERYRVAWRGLAGAGRAAILEARRKRDLLASGMVVVEGDRSFYLFSGSRREAPGEPKHYASYALQWAMMRYVRDRGVRVHDLWGVAPAGAGPDHAWHGVGLFKKGFGGREVEWAGSWDLVVDPTLYRLREAVALLRALPERLRG